MNKKLFVGNLAFRVTDEDLSQMFSEFGQVSSCNVAKDRDTGRSRGFGFVEMQTVAEAEAAIKGMNGMDVEGRQLSVVISEPKPRQTTSSYR